MYSEMAMSIAAIQVHRLKQSSIREEFQNIRNVEIIFIVMFIHIQMVILKAFQNKMYNDCKQINYSCSNT